MAKHAELEHPLGFRFKIEPFDIVGKEDMCPVGWCIARLGSARRFKDEIIASEKMQNAEGKVGFHGGYFEKNEDGEIELHSEEGNCTYKYIYDESDLLLICRQ